MPSEQPVGEGVIFTVSVVPWSEVRMQDFPIWVMYNKYAFASISTMQSAQTVDGPVMLLMDSIFIHPGVARQPLSWPLRMRLKHVGINRKTSFRTSSQAPHNRSHFCQRMDNYSALGRRSSHNRNMNLGCTVACSIRNQRWHRTQPRKFGSGSSTGLQG